MPPVSYLVKYKKATCLVHTLGTNPCVAASFSVEVDGGSVHFPSLNIIEGFIGYSSLLSDPDSIVNGVKNDKMQLEKLMWLLNNEASLDT